MKAGTVLLPHTTPAVCNDDVLPIRGFSHYDKRVKNPAKAASFLISHEKQIFWIC
jgi:hypothetical protein